MELPFDHHNAGITLLPETQYSSPNSTYQVPLSLYGLYSLETDGVTARRRQLASCWLLLQIICEPGALEGVTIWKLLAPLPVGLVIGYGFVAGKLRTTFRTALISLLGTSFISLELLSSSLLEWQVIRRTHRREASCHLTTGT